MVAYVLGLIAGLAQPIQTSLNGKLSDKIRSPYLSTVISFTVALICLVVIVMTTEGSIHVPFADIVAQPWWIWLGGFCGTGIVTLSVICLPYIGSAMVVVLTAFGQVMTSMIIDQFGLFGSPQMPMTLTKVLGTVLVVVGVVMCSKTDSGRKNYPILYMSLAVIAGVLCAVQVGINGTLGAVVKSTWLGTFVSMSIGLLSSLLLVLVIFMIKGKEGVFPGRSDEDFPLKWYMMIGGTMGVIIVGTNAITAPMIGTGLVTIMNLIGFMIGGLVIDATGFLGIEKKPVTRIKMLGVAAMMAGTVVITML